MNVQIRLIICLSHISENNFSDVVLAQAGLIRNIRCLLELFRTRRIAKDQDWL